MARIHLVTPALASANNGNWRTASRWADMLEARHACTVAKDWTGEPADLLVALHARRSAPAVARWRAAGPAPVMVVLTGTDLYRDIDHDPGAQAALVAADRLVLLQPHGLRRLPAAHHAKARVVVQSAPRLAPLPRDARNLVLLMAGHLRPEKDPLTVLRALARLPGAPLRLWVAGGDQDAAVVHAVREAAARDERVELLGALPHAETRERMRAAHLLVLPSVMEGGANVVVEAVQSGLPVVASRIDGTTGLLGDDHPGLFPPGDDAALAGLLQRALDDPGFAATLHAAALRHAGPLQPEAEAAALHALVRELLPG